MFLKQILRARRIVCGLGLFSLVAASGPTALARTVTPTVRVRIVSSQTVAAGGVAEYPFTVQTQGIVGPLSFTQTGLPQGVSAGVRTIATGSYVFTVRVASTSAPSRSTVVLRVRSRANLVSAPITLIVVSASPPSTVSAPVATPLPTLPTMTAPPPTTTTTAPPLASVGTVFFAIGTNTAAATIGVGQTAQIGITVDRTLGYTGPVAFAASGLPVGLAATFTPNPSTAATILSLTPSATTPEGTFAVTIAGTAGSTTQTTTIAVTVLNPPVFALVVPASITAPAGGITNTVIGYQSAGSPNVTITLAGLPSGAEAYFSPNPTFGPTTLVLTLASTTLSGTYPLTVTATANGLIRTYATSLIVAGIASGTTGFGISASPSTMTLVTGGSGIVTVNVVPTGGFSGAITYTVTGLPVVVGIATVSGVNQATITLTVPTGTPLGVYPVTITGTSGALSAAVVISVTIV